jgi:hypothetical protein
MNDVFEAALEVEATVRAGGVPRGAAVETAAHDVRCRPIERGEQRLR